MFGLGFGEILVIGVIALIFIGPDQLPELARTIGRFLNELKRNTDSFKDDLKSKVSFDLEEKRRELRQSDQQHVDPLVDVKIEHKIEHKNEDQLDLFKPEENKKLISEESKKHE